METKNWDVFRYVAQFLVVIAFGFILGSVIARQKWAPTAIFFYAAGLFLLVSVVAIGLSRNHVSEIIKMKLRGRKDRVGKIGNLLIAIFYIILVIAACVWTWNALTRNYSYALWQQVLFLTLCFVFGFLAITWNVYVGYHLWVRFTSKRLEHLVEDVSNDRCKLARVDDPLWYKFTSCLLYYPKVSTGLAEVPYIVVITHDNKHLRVAWSSLGLKKPIGEELPAGFDPAADGIASCWYFLPPELWFDAVLNYVMKSPAVA